MVQKRKRISLVTRMYIAYVDFVYRTSTIRLVENNPGQDYKNCIMGFWHGDCFCNYLLFKHMQKENYGTDLIVTAEPRGNYIEPVCRNYGVNVLRIPNGMGIKGYLNYIKEIAKTPDRILVITLDGPEGPVHKPKKLSFVLSQQAEKSFVKINTEVKRKIRVSKRWDKYIIPLPYNEITFYADKIPPITKEQLRDFDQLQEWCITDMVRS